MTRPSERAYRQLLSLYSRALRVEYGDDMVADFGRMVADARPTGRVSRPFAYGRGCSPT